MRVAVCTIVALFWWNQVGGATPPPKGPGYDAITWPMSMHIAPAHGITLGDFQITFEETTLEAVRARVGTGTISHHGDAAGSEYWLCYTVIKPHRRERLWVISNAEMGRGTVTDVDAITLSSSNASHDCPRLPPQLIPVALDSKPWLGSTATDLERILGKSSHVTHPWQSYNFQTKVNEDGQCEGGYDLLSNLDVKLHNGIVVALSAGQVTSC
jgi:hypothetical protein